MMADFEKQEKGHPATYIETPTSSIPAVEQDKEDGDYDAVFGYRQEGHVDYKSMGW